MKCFKMNKLIKNLLSVPFKSNYFCKIAEILFRNYSSGYILSFHDITSDIFKLHIESLKPSSPIPLDELVDRHKKGKSIKNCFAITFDDGVRDTVLNNWLICKKNYWPVTFFLPTDYINGENLPFQKIEFLNKSLNDEIYSIPKEIINISQKFLSKKNLINYLKKIIYIENRANVKKIFDYFFNIQKQSNKSLKVDSLMPKAISWPEIYEISKNELASFQSHSLSHTACSAMSDVELNFEMLNSKKIIQDFTQKEVTGFCYPYGSDSTINKRSVEIASRHYNYATTLIRGRLKNTNNIYFLPRIDLYQEHSIEFVKMKVALS